MLNFLSIETETEKAIKAQRDKNILAELELSFLQIQMKKRELQEYLERVNDENQEREQF